MLFWLENLLTALGGLFSFPLLNWLYQELSARLKEKRVAA
jgi:hypothetical protein